jgi:hypothetical protein
MTRRGIEAKLSDAAALCVKLNLWIRRIQSS